MSLLAEWRRIPGEIDAVVREIDAARLDDLVGPPTLGLTRRQLVHHVAEANVVAASIIIAALGNPGCTYDWSWMLPFGPWLARLDYKKKPIEPSSKLLEALIQWVAAQIEPLPDALGREVFLKDAPGAEPRRVTVADLLQQEIDHAREHLGHLGEA